MFGQCQKVQEEFLKCVYPQRPSQPQYQSKLFRLLYNFSLRRNVPLKHYHLHGKIWRETKNVALEYIIYHLSAALAQVLAFSFASCIGIRHLFLKNVF